MFAPAESGVEERAFQLSAGLFVLEEISVINVTVSVYFYISTIRGSVGPSEISVPSWSIKPRLCVTEYPHRQLKPWTA